MKPVVPALAVQSEYGFNVQPYWMQHGSSIQAEARAAHRGARPAPRAEDRLRRWRGAGVDSMLVVPRASTHLEYTDIALVLPASRYGQALTSVYVQRWLGRYLKHRRSRLTATRFRYLEPVDVGALGAGRARPRRSGSASTSARRTASGAAPASGALDI